jgi:hypothetical protein
VVNYLARYSHRTAISNQRILVMDEATVSFRYKDYGDGDRQKVLHLSHEEFIHRFLLHVLPKGCKMRHYEEKSLSGTIDSLQEAGPARTTRKTFLGYHAK